MLDNTEKHNSCVVRHLRENQASFHSSSSSYIFGVFLKFFQGLEPRRTQVSTKIRLGRNQALVKAKHRKQCSWRNGKDTEDIGCG